MDDTFSLGFKRKGTWWIVENLDTDSGLFDKELESRLNEIRKYLKDTFYLPGILQKRKVFLGI